MLICIFRYLHTPVFEYNILNKSCISKHEQVCGTDIQRDGCVNQTKPADVINSDTGPVVLTIKDMLGTYIVAGVVMMIGEGQIYICIYTCIHIYMHIHIYININMYIHIFI